MGATRIQGFTTALTDVDVSPQEYLGAVRNDYFNSYKYVRFTGTTAVAVGDVVCYVLTDLTMTSVDGANTAVGAGVAVAAHASGSVSYGWVQIRGPVVLSTAFGAGAVGNAVTTAGAAAPAVTVAAAVTNVTVGFIIAVATRNMYCLFPD